MYVGTVEMAAHVKFHPVKQQDISLPWLQDSRDNDTFFIHLFWLKCWLMTLPVKVVFTLELMKFLLKT
jgi:hypothetical protein